MCYIDKPFLSLLYARKYRLATFCVLVLGILASPIVILASSNGALAEFFSIMIPPAGGILIAVYVYHVYSPDNIRRLGWVDLDGKY